MQRIIWFNLLSKSGWEKARNRHRCKWRPRRLKTRGEPWWRKQATMSVSQVDAVRLLRSASLLCRSILTQFTMCGWSMSRCIISVKMISLSTSCLWSLSWPTLSSKASLWIAIKRESPLKARSALRSKTSTWFHSKNSLRSSVVACSSKHWSTQRRLLTAICNKRVRSSRIWTWSKKLTCTSATQLSRV